ncbi:MAG: sigma-70 family RNA polymerase sigma factor [Planctomycetota bacterium]
MNEPKQNDAASPCADARDTNSSGADAPDTGEEFVDLLRAAKSGSQEAMDRLIRISQPYLLAIANSEIETKLGAKVGASDLVQNSMLSAQRCISEFNGESREELMAWLRGILLKDLKQAGRHFRSAKRNINRERPMPDESVRNQASGFVDLGDSPSTAAALKEQELQLHRAIDALSEQEQQVIQLRNWQRLSFAEIGQQMDRSADAARKIWSRAIVRLQKEMDRQDD